MIVISIGDIIALICCAIGIIVIGVAAIVGNICDLVERRQKKRIDKAFSEEEKNDVE